MILFDSHAHYNDKAFGTEAERHARLKEIMDSGVRYILNAGTNHVSSREGIALAEAIEGMYASVGIHPSDLYRLEDPEAAFADIRALAAHPKAVAIGEIGLDYHWHSERKEFQIEWFERQLALAEELSLPVIVHDRDAHGDSLDVVLRHPQAHGVFHSFSGSVEMARELWRRGWMISFSGVVTFKNARRVQEVAASVPLEYLMVETDAPYLTPHPHRGKRNDSSLMRHTVDMLAELHGVTPDEMARITAQNAARLFSIDL